MILMAIFHRAQIILAWPHIWSVKDNNTQFAWFLIVALLLLSVALSGDGKRPRLFAKAS